MIKRASELKSMDREFAQLVQSLLQFRNVQDIFGIGRNRAAVYALYDSAYSYMDRGQFPHYWLQYAIATLSFEDFEKAERYLNSSYSSAEALSNYDTYHIDNHASRFIIEKAIRFGDKEEAFSAFLKAHQMLLPQTLRKEGIIYPYKVVYFQYMALFERFFDDWNLEQQSAFKKACNDFLKRIRRVREKNEIPELVRCEASLNEVLQG